jgi:hypothetical protein
MRYKQKKDNRIMENARLAFLNQGATIIGMSALTHAIWEPRAPQHSTPPASLPTSSTEPHTSTSL